MDLVARHAKAVLEAGRGQEWRSMSIAASHAELGDRYLYCEGEFRCCSPRMRQTTSGSSARPMPVPYVKDGINNYVVHGKQDAVNPEQTGTKAAAHYRVNVGAGETATIRLRLSDLAPAAMGDPFKQLC